MDKKELLEIISIDHHNKKDLIVTIPIEMLLRKSGKLISNINVLEATKNIFTVKVIKNIFDLNHNYDPEYYISVPDIKGAIAKIVLTRK